MHASYAGVAGVALAILPPFLHGLNAGSAMPAYHTLHSVFF
jgi:hypothetical protein